MTCAVNWTLVLGFTRAAFTLLGALAWPLAALLIAVQFREPLAKAIDRIKKVGAFGVEAELPATDLQQQPRAATPGGHIDANRVGLPPADPLLSHFDELMVGNFEANHLDDESRLAWAIRTASTNWLWWRQENHYRLIFGSQIAALKLLAQAGPQTIDNLRGLFETLGTKPPPAPSYTFENWLGFLQGSGDVAVVPGAQPTQYQVTLIGRNFLAWLPQAGASEQKPF